MKNFLLLLCFSLVFASALDCNITGSYEGTFDTRYTNCNNDGDVKANINPYTSNDSDKYQFSIDLTVTNCTIWSAVGKPDCECFNPNQTVLVHCNETDGTFYSNWNFYEIREQNSTYLNLYGYGYRVPHSFDYQLNKVPDVPTYLGYCTLGSSVSSCEGCDRDADCGDGHCWKDQDPKCYQQGHCLYNTDLNACGECSTEADCGNYDTDPSFYRCISNMDPRCGPEPGYCAKNSTTNSCNQCFNETECGNENHDIWQCLEDQEPECVATIGFCAKNSAQGSCQPCRSEADCGNESTSAWFCFEEEDPQCQATGFCMKNSTSNSCGGCSTETDCGEQVEGVWQCQTTEDKDCGSEELSL